MKLRSYLPQGSGVALGGIGTGSVELRPNGCFCDWLIFNNRPWSHYGKQELYLSEDDFLLALRLKVRGEEPLVKLLRTSYWGGSPSKLTYEHRFTIVNPYQTPWVRPVGSIEYEAKLPLVRLEYEDEKFRKYGLEVTAEVFSPMLINDIKNSSIPALIIKFKFVNKGNNPLEISLLSLMKAPKPKAKGVRVFSKYLKLKDTSTLTFGLKGLNEDHGMYDGSLTLALSGKVTSAVSLSIGTERKSLVKSLRTLLVDFRDDGLLTGPLEAEAREGELYGALSSKLELKAGGESSFTLILAWYYPNHVDERGNLLGHYYSNFFKDSLSVVNYVIANLEHLYSGTRALSECLYDISYEEWLADLASSQLTTLVKSSWLTKDGYFAIWEGGPGCCGLNTVDVLLWGVIGLIYLYPSIAKALIKQISKYLLKPGTPFYEVFALSFPSNMRLYRELIKEDPSIQYDLSKFKKVIAEVIRRTGKDPRGRVPHLFLPSLKEVDTYDRFDLSSEYALIALLTYFLTGDLKYLSEVWDSVKEALRATLIQHDELNLALPYHSLPSGYEGFSRIGEGLGVRTLAKLLSALLTGPNYLPTSVTTFDAWSFLGIATFTSDLWVSALKTALAIAKRVGDKSFLEEFSYILNRALSNLIKLLWNGEYFDLWFDPLSGKRDRACMTASLTGEWYSEVLMGLGYCLDREKIIAMLKKIYENNFKRVEGLINATYPGKPRPSLKGDLKYFNDVGIPYEISCQMDTPWTGVEFSVASHMIWEGLVDEGISVLRSLHERYLEWGLYWNHIECGGHYLRSLVALSLFNSLAGARWDGVNKLLTLGPKLKGDYFKGPVLIPGAILTLEYKEQAFLKLIPRLGAVLLKGLLLTKGGRPSKVTLNGRPIPYRLKEVKNGLLVEFLREIELKGILKVILKYSSLITANNR